MAARPPIDAFASAKITTRNPHLKKVLDHWLGRGWISLGLHLGPGDVVESIELRRRRDGLVLARIVDAGPKSARIVDLVPELAAALKRQKLDLAANDDLTLPAIPDPERLKKLVRAVRPFFSERPARGDVRRRGSIWDFLEQHAGAVDAPADWSREHDHYLYGTPKRETAGE